MLSVSPETDAQKLPGIVDKSEYPFQNRRFCDSRVEILNFNSSHESLLEGTPGQELLADAELADHGLITLGSESYFLR